jgi:hypothetical protein
VKRLIDVLLFRGAIGPRVYLVASAAVLLVQHVVLQLASQRLTPNTSAWAFHLSLVPLTGQPFITFLSVVFTGVVAWLLGALALCRARDAGRSLGWSALAVVPIVQLPTIVYLASRPRRHATSPAPAAGHVDWTCAAQGVLAGSALTVFAVAVGALVFGSYGWALFLVAPFFVGAVTAYLANRAGEIGFASTIGLIALALLLGALGLLGFALEGVICLVLAAPLAVVMGIIGGVAGEALARAFRRPARETLAIFALLPVVFATDRALLQPSRFETRESVTVDAPPALVWDAVTHMGAIQTAPPLLFRLGVAYPQAGVIHGQGVGAIREGYFSTGVAYERVREWRRNQRLAFDVLSDAPSLRELSPYEHVNAPHVHGYFRTSNAQFDLTPLPGDKTSLTLTTNHELDIEPGAYWTPIARWVTHQNKVRVLTYFKALAESRSHPPAGRPAS